MDKTQDQDTLKQLPARENGHEVLDHNEVVHIPYSIEVDCSGFGTGHNI